MDCEQAASRLHDYLDGELGRWRRIAVSRHLDACPFCSQGFRFEVALRRVLVTKCRDDVPVHLAQRVAEALGPEALGHFDPSGGSGLGGGVPELGK